MDELELEFELHPQLAQDCIPLGDFALCRLLLINDANYPWFVLVPRRSGVSEIYHLSSEDQVQLMRESCFLAENLADAFVARKMNVASLGNMVPQLHLHHIVRFEKDPAWPGPVWGKLPARTYTAEQVAGIRKKLQALMSGELDFVPQPA
ncbi:histidine triad (HIT) protein [Marinobacterium aestuarii]|uniref:Histidine triad (HIT) protein n=1 Tax=Marinobacterium aestuarii TaxID=1821621 RepID=A0A1A9EXB9_9GAMM|nr:HIT family protein [Marinobacterium aestuarii]ANG62390.1 histidine triad (HIT) protein [Marinobacterium aestuarii]